MATCHLNGPMVSLLVLHVKTQLLSLHTGQVAVMETIL